MAIYLKPDSINTYNGVKVNSYLLTKHNPNNIAMPSGNMTGKIIGVTIHNTDWISVSKDTTPAEQYTRATINGNMNDVRVHYYVDNKCAWQNLPLSLNGWHAADGSGNGNQRTIAIECIMSNNYNSIDKASEDNAAKLAAYLLNKYKLDINHLYTHTHWLNVRDGKTGTVDQLNTMWNKNKMCPLYILPHWSSFKAKVKYYLDNLNKSSSTVKPTVKPTTTYTTGTYKVKVTTLDIHSGAGSTYSKKGKIKKNEVYTIVEVKTNWGKLKSGIGWVNLNSMTKITTSNTNKPPVYTTGLYKVNSTTLAIYSGPSNTYKKNGSVKKNEIYTIVEVNNGWGKLKSGAGWLLMTGLTKVK